jgi:hypothetical protein
MIPGEGLRSYLRRRAQKPIREEGKHKIISQAKQTSAPNKAEVYTNGFDAAFYP